MFIPRYWSEAAHTERYPDRRQVTVRRFEWSASGQDDADAHARQRVEEALAVLRETGPDGLRQFTRRERTVAKYGAGSIPSIVGRALISSAVSPTIEGIDPAPYFAAADTARGSRSGAS